MKKAKLLLLFVSITLFSLEMSSQDVEGYTYHETDGDVSLYYKRHQWGVVFRAVNERDVTVYVKIVNVKSRWTDGRTRKKDVYINSIESGKAGSKGGLNNDNYAKIKGFSFDRWRWSTQPFETD